MTDCQIKSQKHVYFFSIHTDKAALFQGPVLFEVILCRNYCCFFGRAALLLEQPLCSHQVPFWEADFCFSLKQDVVVG